MDYVVLPFGDRQTLIACDSTDISPLASFPLFPLSFRASMGGSFVCSFAACNSALIVQEWWQTGRIETPTVIELPFGVQGEAFLLTETDELFVGGKADGPWLGRMNLCDRDRHWVSLLPIDESTHFHEKGIDALSITPCGQRLIAYDNLMLPLYAWVLDRSDETWANPRRIKIDSVFTYEHIVSASASFEEVYLITRGINHGRSMQFLRRFDRNMNGGDVLISETLNDHWGNDAIDGPRYREGEEWSQVLATEGGVIFIASGSRGVGRYGFGSAEVQYLGHHNGQVHHMTLIDMERIIAISRDIDGEVSSNRWAIELYRTDDYSGAPINRLVPNVGIASTSCR